MIPHTEKEDESQHNSECIHATNARKSLPSAEYIAAHTQSHPAVPPDDSRNLIEILLRFGIVPDQILPGDTFVVMPHSRRI